MRVRLPFAGVFFLLVLVAAYGSLSSLQVDVFLNEKILHFSTFFFLTIVFYWIVDTNRRRTVHMTLAVCTVGLGIGSEFLTGLLPNDHDFDVYDILANVAGSLAGLGLCSWYHKRMLDRKRLRKQYNAVPGEDPDGGDLELGDGPGASGHEEGVTEDRGRAPASRPAKNLEDGVDIWEESAEDTWEDAENGDAGTGTAGAAAEVTVSGKGTGQ